MLSTFGFTTAESAIGVVVAWTVLTTIIQRRFKVTTPAALALSVIGLGLFGYVIILVGYASTDAALALSATAWIAIGAIAIVGLLRRWLPQREVLLLIPVGLAIAGVAAAYSTLNGSDGTAFDRGRAMLRGTLLPGDTYLQAEFARLILSNQSTHLMHGDWNGGDRPPLQSGLIVLFGVLRDGWDPALGTAESGYSGSFAAQLLLIPAAYALARVVGFGTRASRAALLFSGATLTWIVNTDFTWPKLLAAALTICALVLLVEALRGRLSAAIAIPAAMAGWSASFLAHGSAAFSIIIVAVLMVVLVRRLGVAATWRPLGLGAVIILAMNAPWIYYQRVVEPTTDRLLKWHLAGVIPPNDDAFVDTFRQAYVDQGLWGTVHAKLEGLKVALLGNPFEGMALGRLHEDRIQAEMMRPYAALSLGFFVLAAFVFAAMWRRYRHRVRWSQMDPAIARSMALVGAGFIAVVFWALAMFDPEGLTVHQGSFVWLVVWLVLPMAWLARLRPSLAIVVTMGQMAVTLVLLAVPWWVEEAVVEPSANGMLAVYLIVFVVVMLWSNHNFRLPARQRRAAIVA